MPISKYEVINPSFFYDNRIFCDYINKFEPIANTTSNSRNEALIEHLLEYNRRFQAGEKVLQNIHLLKNPEACVIVTGQQPWPLTGPLYTIYKIITAIILASNFAKKTGKNFVPVFWIESSDSNIANQSTFFFIDKENKLKDLVFPFSTETKDVSFSKISLDLKSVKFFLSKLEENLNGEKKEEIFNRLHKSFQPGFVDWFASLMTLLFSKYGLVLIDPQQPVVQKLLNPIFQKEIENPLISPFIVRKAGDELEKSGYEPSLKIFSNSTFLFLEENGRRRKLEKLTYSREKLLSLLEDNPCAFSPNVALRPIAQDFLLKTSIYVAGPNEMAYWAQLKELYDNYKINMPLVFPRCGATIIPSFISKLMLDHNLSFLDFKNRLDKKISMLVKQNPEIKSAFNYLFPQQVLQERRLNIVQFLVKYGLGFIDELMRIFDVDETTGGHYLIYE